MTSKISRAKGLRTGKRRRLGAGISKNRFLVGRVVAGTEASTGSRRSIEVLVKGGRTVDALLTGKVGVEKGKLVLLRRTIAPAKSVYRIIELLPGDAEYRTLSPKNALLALAKKPPEQHLEVRLDAEGLRDPVDVLVPTRYLATLIRNDVSSERSSADAQGMSTELWGPAPTNGEVSEAEASVEATYTRQRTSVIDECLSRAQAAELLRVTPQAVSDWISRGDLLAFKDRKEWRIPAWQFDPRSDSGLKVGLKELAIAFGGSVVGLSLWVTTPQGDFNGKAPADVLRNATLSKVVSSARAAGHVW